MDTSKNRLLISNILIVCAVVLLVPIYMSPVWWVSLEAPNYPPEAFPDGVRINFHMNGVFNGCEKVEKEEILEEDALDCVHEMDTINHYVGMYPIAAGGPVEVSFSIFLMTLVGVMLIGFLVPKPLWRMGVMGAGFAVLAIWMGLTWYGEGGLRYHSADYLNGRITVLGETSDQDDDEPEIELDAGAALIARLKASLAGETEEEPEEEVAPAEEESADVLEVGDKKKSIAYLERAFREDRLVPESDRGEWEGSGKQLLAWHYQKSLARYFNDPEALRPMVSKMVWVGDLLFWGIIVLMAVFVFLTRRTNGIGHWLQILLPVLLPAIFILEYSGWLGWYGHNMNEMGAFTLKPFMPTVFGQGKVAQFTTNSYPSTGFYMMLLFAALLIVAALLRRKHLQENKA